MASSGLRVAQIVGAAEGADWLVSISAGLRDRGHDVMAIIGEPEGALSARLATARIPYRRHPQHLTAGCLRGLGRSADAAHILRAAATLVPVLVRERIEVVHTHMFNSMLIGRLAAWMAGVPIRVAMVTGPYHLDAAPTLRVDLATQWIDHTVIGGSRHVRDKYAAMGVPSKRLAYTYYGADPERFDPARADGARLRRELGVDAGYPLIGQVAHFYPVAHGKLAPEAVRGRGVKGHEDFVEAARIVLRSRPDARFVLVGAGRGPGGEQHRRAIEARCQALGLSQAVRFTGERDDVPDVLAALDVSVQCSLLENLGGTIESLLMEVPTVATAVGGMPESVVDGDTGRLVPPRDPAALAAAMLHLIGHPDEGRALGAAGRRRMLDGFTISRTVDDIDDIYSRLAARRSLR